jgi:hypothetical protein
VYFFATLFFGGAGVGVVELKHHTCKTGALPLEQYLQPALLFKFETGYLV